MLRIFRSGHQHLYNGISPPWRVPFDLHALQSSAHQLDCLDHKRTGEDSHPSFRYIGSSRKINHTSDRVEVWTYRCLFTSHSTIRAFLWPTLWFRPSKINNETAIAAPLLYVHLYQARFLFHRIFIFILSRACTFMPVDNPVEWVYFLSELLTYSQTPWRCREETRHTLYQTRSHRRGGQ
jgi:hypothetical protein